MGTALAPNRPTAAPSAGSNTQPQPASQAREVQPPAPNVADMQSQLRIGTALSMNLIPREQADSLATITDPIERWRKTNFLDKQIEHAQEATFNISSLVGLKRISSTIADSLNHLPLDDRLKESRLLMARYEQETLTGRNQRSSRDARLQAPTPSSSTTSPHEASFEFIADLARRHGKPLPSHKDLMTPDGKIRPDRVQKFLTDLARPEYVEHALRDLIEAKVITEQTAKEIRAMPDKMQDKTIHDLYFQAMLSGKIKHQAGDR